MSLDAAAFDAILQETRQSFLTEDLPGYLQDLRQSLTSPSTPLNYRGLRQTVHAIKGGASLALFPEMSRLAKVLEDHLDGVLNGRPAHDPSLRVALEALAERLELAVTEAPEAPLDEALLIPFTTPNSTGSGPMTLGSQPLDDILQEVRHCFLEEDAPGYLQSLVQGVQALYQGQAVDYESLLRATHSLKGGAGLAQLPGAATLAHHLEDVLQGLQRRAMANSPQVCELLQQGVEDLALLISQGKHAPDLQADPQLLQALTAIQAPVPNFAPSATGVTPTAGPSGNDRMVRKALETDLEDCLQRLDRQLASGSLEALAREAAEFQEIGTFLGETLDLPWLVTAATSLEGRLQPPVADLATQVQGLIASLRQQRTAWLTQSGGAQPPSVQAPPTPAPRPHPEAPALIPQGATAEVVEPSATTTPLTQVRLPLKRLERLTTTTGELLIRYERLALEHQQLNQANRTLQSLVQQLLPLQEQVQALYDQWATRRDLTPANDDATLAEFDLLEMDRYSAGHTQLQSLQELLLRIQEVRADIDLSQRSLGDDLDLLHQDLDHVYDDLTQARLVPFRTLAQRFLPQIQGLNRRYGKAVHLEILGEEVLVDQVVLEQLQTPLTHLLNNAFDHGIESPEERQQRHKPLQARIVLTAQAEDDQVVITLRDDGRGIDLDRVLHKAIQQGLYSPQTRRPELTDAEILEWIFRPGFSTAAQVSDLSGRGVGLDVVRTQIRSLRGTLRVQTEANQGTCFTITLPRGLSLLPLLLCALGPLRVAIPATRVLDVLPLVELTPTAGRVAWRQQSLSYAPLGQLLPYHQPVIGRPAVALVLSGQREPFAVGIDAILGERQLILKPFDETIPVPPYLSGCTILGMGEMVPVLQPTALEDLFRPAAPLVPPPVLADQPQKPTVLIAEDSVATRRLLERVLSRSHYTVVSCGDGQEALETLERQAGRFGLVISDIEMPRLDGFSLLQRIRNHPDWSHLPVIMLTSRTGDRHRQKALSLGASLYLTKPVMPDVLLEKVTEVLPPVLT